MYAYKESVQLAKQSAVLNALHEILAIMLHVAGMIQSNVLHT